MDSIIVEKGKDKYFDRYVMWNFQNTINPKFNFYISQKYDLITKDKIINKMKNSFNRLSFENDSNGELFSSTVNAIKENLRHDDLIEFLTVSNFLDIVNENDEYYFKEVAYVVNAVVDGLMRYKSHIKTLSEKIHLKLINILKSKILSDLGHTKEIHNFIFSLVDAYSRRSKENLILQELSLLLKESIKKSNRSLIQEIKGKIYSNMK